MINEFMMFELADKLVFQSSLYLYSTKMLLRRLVQSLQLSLNKNAQRFGQAAVTNHDDEPTKHTKHNPHAIKDLQGYEQLEQVKENQKTFTNLHSTQINRASAYFAFSFLPNSVAAFLGTFAPHPQTAIASDCLALPKIYPQGVPIYDSIHKTSHSVIVNKFFSTISPAILVFLTPQPLISLFMYGLTFGVYNALKRKYTKDIVLKLELLPNTEQLVYQKINFFGNISTRTVRVSDLEHFNLNDQVGERDYSQRAVRGLLNRDVTFRIKGTNQLLLFDRNGVWHEEGLNHDLLV